MSSIAVVRPVGTHERYEYSSSSTSDLLKNINFYKIEYVWDLKNYNEEVLYELMGSIAPFTLLNTPKTADDLSILVGEELLQLKYDNLNEGDEYWLFVKVPDGTLESWLILDGVLVDLIEYKSWIVNLMEKDLPPRSREEIEQERLKKIEDERLANLRPIKKGKVAIVRLCDSINFQVATLTLDLNNTTVKQLRTAIAGTLETPPAGVPMASTDAFTPAQVVERAKNGKKNSAVSFDSNNRFRSVLTGKKHGQNPPVGVEPSQRSTLSNDQRLADIKGSVIVYVHVYNLPRESFLSKLKEIGVDAVIDILIG